MGTTCPSLRRQGLPDSDSNPEEFGGSLAYFEDEASVRWPEF